MRDQARIDRIIEKLGKVWKVCPDWRLTQLLVNMGDKFTPELFYVEDEKVEAELDKIIARIPKPKCSECHVNETILGQWCRECLVK